MKISAGSSRTACLPNERPSASVQAYFDGPLPWIYACSKYSRGKILNLVPNYVVPSKNSKRTTKSHLITPVAYLRYLAIDSRLPVPHHPEQRRIFVASSEAKIHMRSISSPNSLKVRKFPEESEKTECKLHINLSDFPDTNFNKCSKTDMLQ